MREASTLQDSLTSQVRAWRPEARRPRSLSAHPNQPEPFYLVSWQSLEIPSLKIHINDAERRRSPCPPHSAGTVISISVVKRRAEGSFAVQRGNSQQPWCLRSAPNWAESDTRLEPLNLNNSCQAVSQRQEKCYDCGLLTEKRSRGILHLNTMFSR